MKSDWPHIRDTLVGACYGAIAAGVLVPVIARWDAMWSPDSGEVWASWAQFVGTIGAVLVAFWIARRDARERKAGAREVVRGFANVMMPIVLIIVKSIEVFIDESKESSHVISKTCAFDQLVNNLAAVERLGIPMLASVMQGGGSGISATAVFVAACAGIHAKMVYYLPLEVDSSQKVYRPLVPDFIDDVRVLAPLADAADQELRDMLGYPAKKSMDIK